MFVISLVRLPDLAERRRAGTYERNCSGRKYGGDNGKLEQVSISTLQAVSGLLSSHYFTSCLCETHDSYLLEILVSQQCF